MHDVMRKRILRKLERLPEPQLYQVLDFVDFLEQRHGAAAEPRVTGFQRFAERLEDGMRARSLAATAVTGTMKVVSTAGRMIDGLSGVFQAGVQAARAEGAATPRPPDRASGSPADGPGALPTGARAETSPPGPAAVAGGDGAADPPGPRSTDDRRHA